MSEIHAPVKPNVTPGKVKLNPDTVRLLLTELDSESQVVLHCSYFTPEKTTIRLWKSTFLVDKHSGHRSELVHAENISMYPNWMHLAAGTTTWFTLVFNGLPKDCKVFDLIEDIPEPGGFLVHNIKRTESDVHSVSIP